MANRANARKKARAPNPTLKTVQAVAVPTANARQFAVPAIGAILFVPILFLYLPVRHYGFVNYDDDIFVTLNSYVRNGLTWQGVRWAFTSIDFFYWPLTWISYMVECQIFGPNPGAMHLANVLFHAVSSSLLFFVLHLMTRRLWCSAFVAGLFALHPLRVESVAWIAERKDVLSAFFWLIAIWCYVRYTRASNWNNYLLVVVSFGAGLLAKSMVVSLPVVFVLLDYWPLGRLRQAESVNRRIWLEKLPLVLMALMIAWVTVRGQTLAGAVSTNIPLPTRLENALTAAVIYIGMLLWPHNLAVMYPYTTSFNTFWIVFCVVMTTALTAGVIWYRKQHPYLLTGWFWYLIVVAPTLGIIQAGPQAYADRFTYIPCIGLLVAAVWLVADLTAKWPNRRWLAAGLGAVLFPLLTWRSAAQIPVWQDSITLFTRAAEVAPASAVNQHNLGFALAEAGQFDAAIPHYESALHADPTLYKADYNLGRALAQEGKTSEAVNHFENALKNPMAPMYESDVRNALGIALAREQKLSEAQAEFQKAVALRPDSAELHANLASSLAAQGRPQEAVAEFERAIALNPNSIQAHRNLAHAWLDLGRKEDAKSEFQVLLQLAPGNAEAQQQLDALK